jgi:hypothetical protein
MIILHFFEVFPIDIVEKKTNRNKQKWIILEFFNDFTTMKPDLKEQQKN